MCRLFLVATSMSDKQIALTVGVSNETIKWHVKNLFRNPNAATRKHLIDWVCMADLLDCLASVGILMKYHHNPRIYCTSSYQMGSVLYRGFTRSGGQ